MSSAPTPQCPYCKVELENVDRIDHGDYNCTQYIDRMFGLCPNCKRNYYWNDIYTYNHSWGFEEETSSGSAFEIPAPSLT